MKIQSLVAKKELIKRENLKPKELPLDPLFLPQNKFIEDTSRFIAVQCSRRAGKTNGLAIRFMRTLEKYPGAQCLYISLTRDSAMSILWPVLQEINDKYNLGCKFLDSRLTMVYPNGAKLRLLGADQKGFIKRFKGVKTPGVGIDEAQDFGPHLQSLVDDVITPALTDYTDGWLALTGTPGPVPKGYFFQITQERKFGYSFHDWTLFNNPYLPDPRAFLNKLKLDRQWGDRNPTLRREWLNEWVLDLESLWIKYSEEDNHFETLPDHRPYNYILGVDLGFKDADALAVLAWSEHDPVTYLVEEVVTTRQGITELVDQIRKLSEKYEISKIVMDEGALGKKIGEEMRRQHHIPVYGADKRLKQQTVAFLNDALRTKRFKAHKDSRFAQDTYLVQIDWEKSTPDKIVIKKEPHSDIIDAVIYSFKESPAFSYEAPSQGPKPGSKEWIEAQPDTIWDAAQEHFQAEAEAKKWQNGWD